MKIKSSYNATIVLPPNVPVYPGAEVDYPHWDKYKDNPAIAWYVEQGHLAVGKSSKKDEPEVVEKVQITEQEQEEDAQKEDLIAQLAELGVKADKRSSVEKLQEKLEEALAK